MNIASEAENASSTLVEILDLSECAFKIGPHNRGLSNYEIKTIRHVVLCSNLKGRPVSIEDMEVMKGARITATLKLLYDVDVLERYKYSGLDSRSYYYTANVGNQIVVGEEFEKVRQSSNVFLDKENNPYLSVTDVPYMGVKSGSRLFEAALNAFEAGSREEFQQASNGRWVYVGKEMGGSLHHSVEDNSNTHQHQTLRLIP